MVDIEAGTWKYSVFIAGQSESGSGVMYYPGGEYFYVITCAHVVYGQKTLRISFLSDPSKDIVANTDIPVSDVYYSPLYRHMDTQYVDMSDEIEDIAIIPVKVPDGSLLEKSDYKICDAVRWNQIYFQGYPGDIRNGADPFDDIDELHGMVHLSRDTKNYFSIRITDTNLDQGGRAGELLGFSGSPVWLYKTPYLLEGMIATTHGATAALGKVYAIKSERIRTLMRERFHIVMPRQIPAIPDEDIAAPMEISRSNEHRPTDNALTSEFDDWLDDLVAEARATLDNLQLQKTIDILRLAVDDDRFREADMDRQKHLLRFLLYCYEIADLDEEFANLESWMTEKTYIQGHDPLRRLTSTFMKRQFQDTLSAAEEYLHDEGLMNDKRLSAIIKTFHALAYAYTKKLPVSESIDTIVNEKEQLLLNTGDLDTDALIYQIIGYVYGDRYHDYHKSVRYLNHSYSIGSDNMVLESLGAAYYFLGIQHATDKDGIVDIQKVDKESLNKARATFLTILSRADELFLSGTYKRMGMVVFNTFYFLRDNYRTVTSYPYVKKYCTITDSKELRDLEKKYALVIVQGGSFDTFQFSHLTKEDEIFLNCIACYSEITSTIESSKRLHFVEADLEKSLKGVISLHLEALEKVDIKDRIVIRVNLINLYSKGIMLFGWDSVDQMEEQFLAFPEDSPTELISSMRNFIDEHKLPLEESIHNFEKTFQEHRSINTWGEVLHLFIRHELFDYADEWYKKLFTENFDLIQDEQEMGYRSYIDYIVSYGRNLKDALRCYLQVKDSIKDSDISGYWELELMALTNTFNHPERFEEERWPFVEENLIPEDVFHRQAFTAYLANLNPLKTREHYCYRPQVIVRDHLPPLRVIENYERDYLCLRGMLLPTDETAVNGISDKQIENIDCLYQCETWHKEISIRAKNLFAVKNEICLDSWSLLYLYYNDKLKGLLNEKDTIYLTHLSVIRLLDELSLSNNLYIRQLINVITESDNIQLRSPGFRNQLPVRDVMPYTEPSSTIALSREMDCAAIIGAPEIDDTFISHFKNEFARVSDLDKLMDFKEGRGHVYSE